MKFKNFLLLALLMSMFCTTTMADDGEKGKNIQVSFIPFGLEKARYGTYYKGNHFDINYKSVIGGTLGYEFALGKSSSLVELGFTRASYDKVTPHIDDPEYMDLLYPRKDKVENFMAFDFMYYWGKALTFADGRFQIPLYIGIGGEYLKGEPFRNFFFDLGAKVRFKYYVSNRVGIFVGATGKYGWSRMTSGSSEKTCTHGRMNLDAGLSFLIN